MALDDIINAVRSGLQSSPFAGMLSGGNPPEPDLTAPRPVNSGGVLRPMPPRGAGAVQMEAPNMQKFPMPSQGAAPPGALAQMGQNLTNSTAAAGTGWAGRNLAAGALYPAHDVLNKAVNGANGFLGGNPNLLDTSMTARVGNYAAGPVTTPTPPQAPLVVWGPDTPANTPAGFRAAEEAPTTVWGPDTPANTQAGFRAAEEAPPRNIASIYNSANFGYGEVPSIGSGGHGARLGSMDVTYDPAAEAERMKRAGVTPYDPNAQVQAPTGAPKPLTAAEGAARLGWKPEGINMFAGQRLADAANASVLGSQKQASEAALQAAQAQQALQHGNYFSQLGALRENKLNELQSSIAEKGREADQKIAAAEAAGEAKAATTQDQTILKAALADPAGADAKLLGSVGGDVAKYKAAKQLLGTGKIEFKAKPFTTGFPTGFRDENPAGYYKAGDYSKPVDIHDLASQFLAQAK